MNVVVSEDTHPESLVEAASPSSAQPAAFSSAPTSTAAEKVSAAMAPEFSREELMFGLRYAIRYGTRLARFYDRLQALMRFLMALSGTGAFISLFGDKGQITGWLGLLVAILALVDLVVDPAKRAEQCRNAVREAIDLNGRAPQLSLEQLRAEDSALADPDIPEILALRQPVQNAVLLEVGRADAVFPLTWWERLVSAVI